MNAQEIEKIKKQIENLPKGSIYNKKINGITYPYWQFRENGKTISKRVKGEELEILKSQIAQRKQLEAKLKKEGIKTNNHTADNSYHTTILTGGELLRFTNLAAGKPTVLTLLFTAVLDETYLFQRHLSGCDFMLFL